MKKFVLLKKQSKTAQREYHSHRRTDWGNVNSTSRIEKDRCRYDRKCAKALLRRESSKEDFFSVSL